MGANNTIILKGNKIVLPPSLHQQAIDLAHSGHQGIVKTSSLLREKVWFNGMNKRVEEAVRNCQQCQVSTPTITREPLKMSPLPAAPWVELSADFGQVANGQYILVIQDEYSRYVVVETLTSLTASSVIPRFDKVFSEFGIPTQLKTDNGPPFNSSVFAEYLKHMGVHHRKITPLWPRANGETERFMRTVKKVVRGKPNNWKQEMHKMLLAYRATPHTSTGIAPATVLFGRDIGTKLPSIIERQNDSDLREVDKHAKDNMKRYADSKAYVKPSDLNIGDNVLVKDMKSKMPYETDPLTIISKKGSMISAKRGPQIVTRNSSFFKRSPKPPVEEVHELEPTLEVQVQADSEEAQPQVMTVPVPSPIQRRPQRQAGLPSRFKEFSME